MEPSQAHLVSIWHPTWGENTVFALDFVILGETPVFDKDKVPTRALEPSLANFGAKRR